MGLFKILLIAYKNRSGSTLLSNWLSKDERILVLPEGGDVPIKLLVNPLQPIDKKSFDFIKENLQTNSKLSSWNINSLHEQLLFSSRLTSWQLLKNILELYKNQTKEQATVFVLKHPRFADLPEKLSKFSFYRDIIFTAFLIRDGRAIYNSSKKSLQSNLPVPMEYNPVQSAKYWINFVNAASDCITKYSKDGLNASVVKYEDILINQESTLKKIYLFIGLEYTNDKLKNADLAERIDNKQKHLHANIDTNPVVSRIDSWHNELSSWEIYLFEQKAKDSLLLCGYALSHVNLNIFQAFVAHIKLYFQITFNYVRLLYHKIKLK
jgi:hypothetical protein